MSLLEEIQKGTPRKTIIQFLDSSIPPITQGIHLGTLKLKRSLCELTDNIQYGGCISSSFECTLEGTTDLTGKEIKVYQEIEQYTLPLFVGKIKSCLVQSDRLSYAIIGYDILNELMTENVRTWYENLTFPINIGAMLKSLLDYYNIPYRNFKITQDFNVERNIYGDLLFSTVLKNICELCGGFGIIDSEGYFDIIYFTTKTQKDITTLTVQSGFSMEKYTVKPISAVKIQSEKNDVGGIYGEGTNCYTVTGNFLCFGKSGSELKDIAKILYNTIKDNVWKPFTANLPISNPLIGCDGINYRIKTSQGDDFHTFIMDSEFSDVQLFTQQISSSGSEYRKDIVTTSKDELEILKMKSFVVEKSVEGVTAEVKEIGEEQGIIKTDLTQVKLDVDGLDIRIETIENQVDGSVTIYTSKEVPTLDNYPANSWFLEYYPPHDDLTAVDYQFPSENTWLFSNTEYRKHLGTIVYVEGTPDAYKFILNENNEYSWILLSNTETGYILSQLMELKATTDGLSSTVSNTVLKVDGQEAKIQENSTKIQQTTTYIEQSVVKDNEVISKINASTEGIGIVGKQINLEGVVTANNNFKILADGSMQANNGHFSGKLETEEGMIGGFNIRNNALYTSAEAYVNATEQEYTIISNAVQNGQGAQLYKICPYYDLDGDGQITLKDVLYIRQMIEGVRNYSDSFYKNKKKVKIYVIINANDSNKLIEFSGTNAWNNDFSMYFGLQSILTHTGKFQKLESNAIEIFDDSAFKITDADTKTAYTIKDYIKAVIKGTI